jgi:hypothetical protein
MVDSFICSVKKKYFHAHPGRMLVDFAHNLLGSPKILPALNMTKMHECMA